MSLAHGARRSPRGTFLAGSARSASRAEAFSSAHRGTFALGPRVAPIACPEAARARHRPIAALASFDTCVRARPVLATGGLPRGLGRGQTSLRSATRGSGASLRSAGFFFGALDLERRRELPGHPVGLFQGVELFTSERTDRSGGEPFCAHTGERHARKAHDREAGGLSHTANLLVSALFDGELEPGFVPFVAQEVRFGGKRGAIFERDAVAPSIEVLLLHDAAHLDHVGLRDGALRVQEAVRELAVVGREQRPRGGEVEASDRKKTGSQGREHAGDGGPTFGVTQRGNDAARLVADHVHGLFGHHALAVELDLVGAGIGARPELGHHSSVHAHTPGRDDFFGGAPRRDTAAREDFLQSFLSHEAEP